MSRYYPPLSIYAFLLTIVMKDPAITYSHISLQYQIVRGQRVAKLRLMRPDSRNCINGPMAEEIRDACLRIGEDDDCRLVTITGSGAFFSVGRAPLDPHEGPVSSQLRRLKVADAVGDLAVPVLVQVNGEAVGHGLELAMAGDLRIAADTARFSLRDPLQPSMPWDGGTQRLPRLVGPAWALDMTLTGRYIDASQALRIGLVNRVSPPGKLEEATRELEEQVLSSAPVAARYAKEAVRKGMDLTVKQGLGLEADLSIILQGTGDRAEGIESFKERRPPRFEGT